MKRTFALMMMLALVAFTGCRDWFPPTNPKDPVVDPPASSLQDSRWCLTSINNANTNPIDIDPALGMYVEFKKDGNVAGFGGCNGFGGSYEATDKLLTIGSLVGTEMWCGDKSRYESMFMQALMGATSYKIDGTRLIISYKMPPTGGALGGNGTLVFDACDRNPVPPTEPSDLTGVKWCLEGYSNDNMNTIEKGAEGAYIIFHPQTPGAVGKAEGFGGCNTFSAAYTAADPRSMGPVLSMKITNLVSTKIACPDGAAESRFFSALAMATSYSISGDQLTITYASAIGAVTKMVFKKCDDGGNPGGGNGTVVSGKLGERMEIPYGATGVIESEGVKFTFKHVTDNRCPLGVQCITAGNARVTFFAMVASMNAVWTFDVNQPDMPHSADFGSYTLELVEVNPHPTANTPQIPLQDYVATVIVTKR